MASLPTIVPSKEIVVGATLGFQYEMHISFYHPHTNQSMTVLLKHFGSPLSMDVTRADYPFDSASGKIDLTSPRITKVRTVKFRYPEIVNVGSGTNSIKGGLTVSSEPSREVDFAHPSKGTWPIGEMQVWIDRYVRHVGEVDYFKSRREVAE
jgi:hypothetical protein